MAAPVWATIWSVLNFPTRPSRLFFFFQAEDGIRDIGVTGVQTCALPISGTDGALRLSGFDYEVSAEAELEVSVAEAGAVLVPGRLLADITRSLPGQPVDLATDGARVQLTCGTARFTLPTLPLDEYPTLPSMPEVAGTIGSDAFSAAVSSVAVAAGRAA